MSVLLTEFYCQIVFALCTGIAPTEKASLTEAPQLLLSNSLVNKQFSKRHAESSNDLPLMDDRKVSQFRDMSSAHDDTTAPEAKRPRTLTLQQESVTATGRKRVQPLILEEKPWAVNFSDVVRAKGSPSRRRNNNTSSIDNENDTQQAESVSRSSINNENSTTMVGQKLELQPANPNLKPLIMTPITGRNRHVVICKMVYVVFIFLLAEYCQECAYNINT